MQPKKKRINTEILEALRIEPGCCAYCGKRMNQVEGHKNMETVDHIFPKSNGGNDSAINRLPCCRNCNQIKGSDSLEYFLSQIRFRIDANIGNSKLSYKRLKHMEKHIENIIFMIKKHRKQCMGKPPGPTAMFSGEPMRFRRDGSPVFDNPQPSKIPNPAYITISSSDSASTNDYLQQDEFFHETPNQCNP